MGNACIHVDADQFGNFVAYTCIFFFKIPPAEINGFTRPNSNFKKNQVSMFQKSLLNFINPIKINSNFIRIFFFILFLQGSTVVWGGIVTDSCIII